MRASCLLPLALLLGTPARAQAPAAPAPARTTEPDESWAQPPVEAPRRNETPDDMWRDYPGPTSVPPEGSGITLPRLPEPPPLLSAEPTVRTARVARPLLPPGPPPPPNRLGLYGGRSLGMGHLAVGLSLGFPLLSVRAALGVLPRLDVGLGMDSFYGMMNEARVGARFTLLDGGDKGSLGLVVDGGRAFFLRPADVEQKGARYLSGRRNWNLLPGLVGSWQLSGPRAPRAFLDVRYQLAWDTEPVQRTPLGGLPPAATLDGAFVARMGAEVPVSEKTSYVVSLGGDFRNRPEDAGFMPALSLGVVSALW